jgi:transposase
MARLTGNQRSEAIGMLRAGMTIAAVAQHFGCSRTTIHSLQRRFAATGSVYDQPRTGRPRVLTRRQDAYIRVTHMRNRFLSASDTARNTIGVQE